MGGPCKKIKYVKKRKSKSIAKPRKISSLPRISSDRTLTDRTELSLFYYGEGESDAGENIIEPPKNPIEELKKWIRKQRFIPQDLTDEFLIMFLSGVGYDIEDAAEKMHKYFYSRQEPSLLFRHRDPLSPENAELFRKMYVIPMPDTTVDGKKVILMGLMKPLIVYNQLEHAKMLAMVFDLLIWEKDLGFGDFAVIFDGRGFECPQLLEKTVRDHRTITRLLLDTIPGTLRSFYLFQPPPHVANVADNRNGIWVTVVKSKQEMISYIPADNLPLEFGGNLGCLNDLSERWHQHLEKCRHFFIHFEARMINDYRRRLCHEREVKDGGKDWISKLKLEADEWEYKTQYYERMRNGPRLEHPGFGADRVRKMNEKKKMAANNFLKKCKKLMVEQEKALSVFDPIYAAAEKRKIHLKDREDENKKQTKPCFRWNLSFEIQNCSI